MSEHGYSILIVYGIVVAIVCIIGCIYCITMYNNHFHVRVEKVPENTKPLDVCPNVDNENNPILRVPLCDNV